MLHIITRAIEDVEAGAYILWVYLNPIDGRIY